VVAWVDEFDICTSYGQQTVAQLLCTQPEIDDFLICLPTIVCDTWGLFENVHLSEPLYLNRMPCRCFVDEPFVT
jgi:hypothetical protein